MTSNHHAPYILGYTRTTMAKTKGSEAARRSKPHACTKLELLVIADQHAAVNTFPGFVHTARQTMKVENTRSQWANRKGAAVEGGFNDWG